MPAFFTWLITLAHRRGASGKERSSVSTTHVRLWVPARGMRMLGAGGTPAFLAWPPVVIRYATEGRLAALSHVFCLVSWRSQVARGCRMVFWMYDLRHVRYEVGGGCAATVCVIYVIVLDNE
ncbi:hypothetical protein E2562_017560 [Oryza meyeriana var. granulata]|uniref:Uncharacterized protein n=1 Tax=Oryza meyeriana var. granulata TaxID=110450 RepID=A0A6G1C6Z4_9ORYZ|nr:hypothetical protein E2562_017560 [Oryza meyeriana var. granulata]